MTSTANGSATLLTLAEIAAWQVSLPPAKPDPIVAALPALQRGAVWKVKQIEELWDSILRRFPIGSFVIAPLYPALEQQNFKLQSDQQKLPTPTHLLLDGQQRATGIALGFYDIWGQDIKDAKSSLWLDLADPPDSRDAEFILRVVTRAHPWGYKRVNPDDILSAHQIRAALLAFQAVNHHAAARPEEFSLRETWPWDAEAPVPLALLIDAVNQHSDDLAKARNTVWQRIQTLPMFITNPAFPGEENNGRVENDARQGLERQRQRVREAFEKRDSQRFHLLDCILLRIQKILANEGGYLVPALPLDLQDTAQTCSQAEEIPLVPPAPIDSAKTDAIELLFVRVNSAGTPLAGEELTYSLLKAAWPDAASFIDGLKHKPALASRIAMFCVRLILARSQSPANTGLKLTLPAAPGVNEFRRLVRNQNPAYPTFYDNLTSFIQNDANTLFTDTWLFLTSGPYALLPVLAVELAQKSPDVYFLLLRWIDRLRAKNISPNQIQETTHRRTLGFLTALAWFARDKNRACASIWTDLQVENDDKKLIDFFNSERFIKTCHLDERFNLRMIPLPTVEELDLACKRGVTGHQRCTDTISKPDSAIWTDWNWYNSFVEILVKDTGTKEKWNKLLTPEMIQNDDEWPDLPQSINQASRHFLDTLWDLRPILLYAQRDWLRKWYPGFDPSQPEYMEDKNRPWDYDHILPQKLWRGESGWSLKGIPTLIKDWCVSVGNLRAWPLEANRADSDISPTLKLTQVSPEEGRYSMNNEREERKASFVDETLDWPLWQKSVPMAVGGSNVADRRYLALVQYHDYRKALIIAIVLRFVALYREWYDQLKISDLQ
ncbi:MAG: DUF262 domain-containing protein [Chromatiaceae bacterium]|nr:DUF262 domain-containing protein [Chromatiaceae bacterium]